MIERNTVICGDCKGKERTGEITAMIQELQVSGEHNKFNAMLKPPS